MSNYVYWAEDSSEAIEHHGTLGMKWGKRRYQYEDGSLTPEGRRHYGVGAPRVGLAGRIDEYRRKRLQAKVERETQKRVAAQQKLKAAEADTDTKLQKDKLKNKALVEEETAKRQAAEERLATAKANAKAETANANAEKAKADAASTKRQARIDAIKGTIQQLTSGDSVERAEAKAQKKMIKMQMRQAKTEEKLRKAQVKEEIRKLKEARKAEKEKKNAQATQNEKPKEGNSAGKFTTYEALYAHRHSLTDSEFKAAKNRLDEEAKIYEIVAKSKKAAFDKKLEVPKAIGGFAVKGVKVAFTNPAVAAGAVAMGYGAYKAVQTKRGKATPKADEAAKILMGVFATAAAAAGAVKSAKPDEGDKDEKK